MKQCISSKTFPFTTNTSFIIIFLFFQCYFDIAGHHSNGSRFGVIVICNSDDYIFSNMLSKKSYEQSAFGL